MDRASSPTSRFCVIASLLAAVASFPSRAESSADELPVLKRFTARDTLAPAAEDNPDARQCLRELTWPPASFDVTWTGADRAQRKTFVHFPSPVPSGDAANDRVTMEWYRPLGEAVPQQRRPAVLVVHESGSRMPVGRLFARSLQAEGLHAFMIYLPYYGTRRGNRDKPQAEELATVIRQAMADVRRARDAIAVLPEVDPEQIAVQGTSLGGFVVATAAALDRGFQGVHIMLAGGNLYRLVMEGQQDAASLRRELERAGISGEALRELLWTVEPTRLAHRLDPQRTWLYTAEQDLVVPLENAAALARAAGLDDDHHVRMPADHYTAILYLATVVRQVAERTRASAEASRTPPSRSAQ